MFLSTPENSFELNQKIFVHFSAGFRFLVLLLTIKSKVFFRVIFIPGHLIKDSVKSGNCIIKIFT